MTDSQIKSAAERRLQARSYATSLGINEAYISTLVDTFYERVLADPVLGPIFDKAINDNWAPHLKTMKAFWASVALSTGQYSGKPVPAHKKHSAIESEHFAIWLSLFEQTLKDTAPSADAVPYFMERANRIAQSLQLALFGLPSLRQPN